MIAFDVRGNTYFKNGFRHLFFKVILNIYLTRFRRRLGLGHGKDLLSFRYRTDLMYTLGQNGIVYRFNQEIWCPESHNFFYHHFVDGCWCCDKPRTVSKRHFACLFEKRYSVKPDHYQVKKNDIGRCCFDCIKCILWVGCRQNNIKTLFPKFIRRIWTKFCVLINDHNSDLLFITESFHKNPPMPSFENNGSMSRREMFSKNGFILYKFNFCLFFSSQKNSITKYYRFQANFVENNLGIVSQICVSEDKIRHN